MKKVRTIGVAATAASILTAALVATPTVATAQTKKKSERCADVVKGGKNTCAVKSLGISCQGNAKLDNMKGAWIKVPGGTCGNIVAICTGKVQAPEGVNQKRLNKACSKIADQTDPSITGGRLVDRFGESI